jgi:hypothetical protein
MSDTCPNGHTSADPDWCDTCGAPMHGPSPEAAAAATPDPPAASVGSSPANPGGAPTPCPHCGEMNGHDALFCESCGYDFVTGQAPEPDPAPPAAVVAAPAGTAEPAAAAATPTVATGWIVVVEVDTQWHSLKGELADRPLPPPSTSTVPLAHHTSLVGRTSQSRGLKPEVPLDADTAVSRRHAQFVSEDDQLSIVDLSSTNGTYVLSGTDEPTDATLPIASGAPTVLADGDRVYLGAWSRLTVRKA